MQEDTGVSTGLSDSLGQPCYARGGRVVLGYTDSTVYCCAAVLPRCCAAEMGAWWHPNRHRLYKHVTCFKSGSIGVPHECSYRIVSRRK